MVVLVCKIGFAQDFLLIMLVVEVVRLHLEWLELVV
jgi:hypothetical protein